MTNELSWRERLTAHLPKTAVNEAIAIWALCFFGIVIAWVAYRPAAAVVATLGFLYLPSLSMDRRGEDFAEYGVNLRSWRADLWLFAVLFALILPLFAGGYALWVLKVLPLLPDNLHRLLSPYPSTAQFHPRLPDRFFELVVHNYFVVALPEEFFYRGFIQTRLRDAWPKGPVVLGARLGRAWWVTCVLFALGHLAIFEAWRLAVFFPALLFGWMRERTGSVMGAALLHGSCNLLIRFLEVSFY